MSRTQKLTARILDGHRAARDEILALNGEPTEELCAGAEGIRKAICGDAFDICTIINAKSGRCSENCKFCAQSSFYRTKIEEYPLLGSEEILNEAKRSADKGVMRFSIVTSGKRPSREEIEKIGKAVRDIRKNADISVCASIGLVDGEDLKYLKSCGLSRIHNNLESSREFFKEVCTTHAYDEKTATITEARKAGLSVCSGGMIGLGETMEDRIDLAMTLRSLEVKSVPINILNPIEGTPYAGNERLPLEEILRTIALFRFIMPDAFLRLAGGRALYDDLAEKCLGCGINALISGDMLTTRGISIDTDMELIERSGFRLGVMEE